MNSYNKKPESNFHPLHNFSVRAQKFKLCINNNTGLFYLTNDKRQNDLKRLN